MTDCYEHLGPFGDWAEGAKRQRSLYPAAPPILDTREQIRALLGFSDDRAMPQELRAERSWERAGIAGEEMSWSVGYGPPTLAWVLRSAGVDGPLPGVLALHDHGGIKFFGKEKVADGPQGPTPGVAHLQEDICGGRAFANELAGRGFVVLVHDAFLWGSRRFPMDVMPETILRTVEDFRAARERLGEVPDETELYDVAAPHHEHVISKYCALLGTTLAGVIAHEDRLAADYLGSRPDVIPSSIGCVGLPGGGCRAALLQATCDQIRAAVVVGMMTAYEHLLDRHVESHTWMFFPPGLARLCDWPDLAASRAPSPLLVQYNWDDHLFTAEGMEAAHQRITNNYRTTNDPTAYTGEFYEGPHRFDLKMQEESAFDWLECRLRD